MNCMIKTPLSFLLTTACLCLTYTTSAYAQESQAVTAVAETKKLEIAKPISIDVVIDALIIHDVKGPVDGIYEDANDAMLDTITEEIHRNLGSIASIFSINTANGFMADVQPMFYANDDQITDRQFRPHFVTGDQARFGTPEFKQFGQKVFALTAQYSKQAENGFLTGFGVRKASYVNFPISTASIATTSDARYLLLAQVYFRHVPLLKSVGVGLLTATVDNYQAHLEGRNFFVYTYPLSNGAVNLVLIDRETSKAVWAGQKQLREFTQTQDVTGNLLRVLAQEPLFEKPKTDDGSLSSNSSRQYSRVYDMKVALKKNEITRAQYDELARQAKAQYIQVLAELDQKLNNKEISEAAYLVYKTNAKMSLL